MYKATLNNRTIRLDKTATGFQLVYILHSSGENSQHVHRTDFTTLVDALEAFTALITERVDYDINYLTTNAEAAAFVAQYG